MITIPIEAKQALIIEDDEQEFKKIKGSLENISEIMPAVFWEPDYKKGLRRLLDHNHDLCVIDFNVNGKTDTDLLQLLATHFCEEPVVILTDDQSHIDHSKMEDCAAVFLPRKKINPESLRGAIGYALERSAFLKRLHSHQRKYQHLFEHSKDGVFVANKDFVVQTVNGTAVKVLEYPRQELVGRSIFDLMEPDKRMTFNKEQLLTCGGIEDLEIEFLTKSNQKKNCILSVYIEDGISEDQEFNVLGILHDITHLRRAESMAMVERMLYALVLEVRNTLSNINVSLDQLSPDVLNAETRTHFEIILRNVKRILKLISALSSHPDPAAIHLMKKPLQSVMDEAIEDVIDLIIERKINLVIHYAKEPSFTRIDKERVKAAFVSIMLNAIASMPEKSGKLQIEIKSEADKHIVEIKDNRYTRREIASRKNPVTLLNSLSILQSAMVQIDVSSANQNGTTFTMEFARA